MKTKRKKTPTNSPAAQTGLACPNCKFQIKFTIADLLTQRNVSCPECDLSLDMQVPSEMKKHLQEISLAEKMVRDAKNFSR